MKKNWPKSIYFLLFIYILAVWFDVVNFSNYKVTSDYAIYENLNIGFLFLPIQVVLLALNILTVFYLLRHKLKGLYFGVSSLVVSFITTMGGFVFTLLNPELMKEFYRISREARGLSVREEALDLFFSTQGILLIGLVTLLWYMFVGFLLHKNTRWLLILK